MPYIVFDELAMLFDSEDTAKSIYAIIKSKYSNRDCEELIKNNIEYAKIHNKGDDLLTYLREAIENDYAASKSETAESDGTALDELTRLFYDEDRANRIYNHVKDTYPSIDCDELIRKNIEFAKQKEKRLKTMFLGYLEEAISKDLAGYVTTP
jgi:hypothetical protein